MPNIYLGDIKRMFVKKLEIDGDNLNTFFTNTKKVLGEEIIERDSLFYNNYIGNTINFYYDNKLADRQEAIDYLKNDYGSSIIFVDYPELIFKEAIDKKRFKALKKFYKYK